MTLVEVVFLAGAQCLSPMAHGPGLTEVAKVPCAVLVQVDPQTADVAIVPPAAATDPAVIAMLVKPRPGLAVAKADRLPLATAGDVTGSIGPAPRIVPTSAEPEVVLPKARPLAKKKPGGKTAVTRKRPAVASRNTACGSYRAVWYVNKDGHRRYRCVRPG